MGFRRGFSRTLIAACAVLALAMPAAAQFSDSYNFIKAVRDADGGKVMEFLNKPGQPVLNTRDSATGDSALHIVVKRHDENWLGFLLSRGPQIDIKDRAGNTPLMTAVQLSDVDSARLLLQSGAKPNVTNANGETPLIVAVQHRAIPIVRLLIQNGADPKITDHIAGKTARDYAAEDPRGSVITKILDDARPRVEVFVGPEQH